MRRETALGVRDDERVRRTPLSGDLETALPLGVLEGVLEDVLLVRRVLLLAGTVSDRCRLRIALCISSMAVSCFLVRLPPLVIYRCECDTHVMCVWCGYICEYEI